MPLWPAELHGRERAGVLLGAVTSPAWIAQHSVGSLVHNCLEPSSVLPIPSPLTWQDLLDLACPSGLQNCTDESWLKLKNATKVTIEELAYLAEVSRQITTMYPNFALIMNCTYVAVIIKVGRGKGEGGRGIEGRGGALREG